MSSMIVVFVVLAVLAVVFVAAAMFFDVAFGKSAEKWRVSLPLLGGESLRRWAAARSRQVVGRALRQQRDGAAVGQAVEQMTAEVVDQAFPHGTRRTPQECPPEKVDPVLVSAPEVLAIVDELHHRHAPEEIERIRTIAAANAAQLAAGLPSSEPAPCALHVVGHSCATYETRPLQCRSQCPECQSAAEFSRDVAAGAAAGLAESLADAGLDSRRYELNAALAATLVAPEAAAARFAHGEPLLSPEPNHA